MSDEFEEDLPSFPLRELVAAGMSTNDRSAFRASRFYRSHGAELEDWIAHPRCGAGRVEPSSTGEQTIRLVHWNLEQGKAWDRIVRALDETERLRGADLWSLNEVEIGMARSGNRHIVRDLARRLGLHWVFVANYFELTKGPGQDRLAPGENAVGLHGIALLSRWPIEAPGSAPLPEIFDYFAFPEEKRYGRRRLLWATVRHPEGPFLFATTHLEVRNTPGARARQISAALEALPDGEGWLAGDWNTHTFRRGNLLRSAREFLRLQITQPESLQRRLLDPRGGEPLLRRVVDAGFELERWNEPKPTAKEVLSGVEELSLLPGPVRRWLTRRCGLEGRVLKMRLDWIASRGRFRPSGDSAVWTGTELGPEGVRASDHAPIGVAAERR